MNDIESAKIFKREASLVYTTVDSIYNKILEGKNIIGKLYCNLSIGKAAFDSDEPIFFDYVKGIDLIFDKKETAVEICTDDEDIYLFTLST